MDARLALLVLRRWWPLLVAGTLIAAGAAYAVSKTLPRVYQATALLHVNPGLGTVGGGLDFNEVQASWSQAAADAQLIHTTPIAQAAIDRVAGHLQRPVDPGTLLKDSAATAAPQSSIVMRPFVDHERPTRATRSVAARHGPPCAPTTRTRSRPDGQNGTSTRAIFVWSGASSRSSTPSSSTNPGTGSGTVALPLGVTHG